MERKWFVVAVVGLLLAGALLYRELAATRADAAADRARLAGALERNAALQAEQAARLAQLEAQASRSTALPASATPVPAQPRAQVAHLSNEQVQRTLEDRFVTEPLSPPWAARNEAAVDAFLDGRNLAKLQLPAPRDHAVACRSRTCRIELVYDDYDQGSATQERLLMAIAESMPTAQLINVARPDGTIAMVIFASDGAGDPAR